MVLLRNRPFMASEYKSILDHINYCYGTDIILLSEYSKESTALCKYVAFGFSHEHQNRE